jgi:hypothetical protein
MSESISGITYSVLVYNVSTQSTMVEQITEQYAYSQLSYDVQVSTTQPPQPPQQPQPPKQQTIQPNLVWIIMLGLLLLLLLAGEKEEKKIA